MLDCKLHRDEFNDRLDNIEKILSATHPADDEPSEIARDMRGVAIVLVYAAYENLLINLCRSLLEAAVSLRVGNKRLRPGFKIFAAHSNLSSIASLSPTKLWKAGFALVDALSDSSSCTISVNTFPNDGTNFKRTQVTTFCDVFGLGDPGPVLQEVWQRIDAVVVERNGIAHGKMAPGEVGRNYSLKDLRGLINSWRLRWNAFIDWVEVSAASRDFFRTPR